ncbi:2-phospho-L-lactate guanylyltransferase [Polaribacter huanghezhanensis]|uniref:TIGR04282 family arsenosugar biosynthesis glycosyltransferase n=1 Tax=Polaribacter huanghezhanensis TaxID=1354726 RepID=UPI002649D6F2|nr:TIGR04282 family arsenosugar biosynthesis glycosyltransferase [Polaribacter huanghezhanensis]WKD85815.1 2-phospho-L-lactate guanylyltransferase [Polaribacter huanghezhanensis]
MSDKKSQEKRAKRKDKDLLIIFVKNIILGKVKTRLAKRIGAIGAFKIYSELAGITEKATSNIKADRHIYFSDAIISSKWKGGKKFVQEGEDLGIKMQNAFQNGFEEGYENILLIGSDLPDISKEIIDSGFESLAKNDVVFGPAEDGGYYLIGMSKMNPSIFKDKPWSQSELLTITLAQLKEQQQSVGLIKTLNDIDTFEDLIDSHFYKNNPKVKEIIEKKIQL